MWQQTYLTIHDLISQTSENTIEGVCVFVADIASWMVFDKSNSVNPISASFIAITDYGRWVKIENKQIYNNQVPLRIKRLSQNVGLSLYTSDEWGDVADFFAEEIYDDITGNFITPRMNIFLFFNVNLFHQYYSAIAYNYFGYFLKTHFFDKSVFFATSFVPYKKYNFTILNRTQIDDDLYLAPGETLKIWVFDNLNFLLPFFMANGESKKNFYNDSLPFLIELLKKNAAQFVEVNSFNKPFSLSFSNLENIIIIETVFRDSPSTTPFRAYLPCDFYSTKLTDSPQGFLDSVSCLLRTASPSTNGGFYLQDDFLTYSEMEIPKESAILLDGAFIVSPKITDSFWFDEVYRRRDENGLVKNRFGDSLRIPEEMFFDQLVYNYDEREDHPLDIPFEQML